MTNWSFNRHRKASPQFNESVKHSNRLFLYGLLFGFILGIIGTVITQIWIFPKIFNKEPNISLILHNRPDPYLTEINNINDNSYKFQIKTDTSVTDLRTVITIPGVMSNFKENGRNQECEYAVQKMHNFYREAIEYSGSEILNIHCKKIGNDGSYQVRFDLDGSVYEPVMLQDKADPNKFLEISKFQKIWCYYFFEGYNNTFKKDCSIEINKN